MKHLEERSKLQVEQEWAFAETCLPLTMQLAVLLENIISPALTNIDQTWPFTDRILVWLVPSMVENVMRYHAAHGPSMAEIFKPWQLDHLDLDLLAELKYRLEQLYPGVLSLLSDNIEYSEDR